MHCSSGAQLRPNLLRCSKRRRRVRCDDPIGNARRARRLGTPAGAASMRCHGRDQLDRAVIPSISEHLSCQHPALTAPLNLFFLRQLRSPSPGPAALALAVCGVCRRSRVNSRKSLRRWRPSNSVSDIGPSTYGMRVWNGRCTSNCLKASCPGLAIAQRAARRARRQDAPPEKGCADLGRPKHHRSMV